ncbi:MAG: DUF6160 family protein [Desulfobacteraceae bacterium]
MKRFIVSLAAAAILSMPMAASALEKMDNSQLRSATGQAGVSIAIDDIVIYQKSLADTTYWDIDGIGDGGSAGGIMIDHADDMQKLITIDAILDGTEYGVTALQTIFGNTDAIGILDDAAAVGVALAAGELDPTNGNMAGMTTGISPLTIDVGTCQALTAGWVYNTANRGADLGGAEALNVGGVVIGLPTVEITTYTTSNFKSIKLVSGSDNGDGTVTTLTPATGASYFNTDHEFITIEKSGDSTMAILGGRLEIAPH